MKTTSKRGKNLKVFNPKHQPLTIEKLRSWENFRDLTDEQAKEIVEAITTLADILVDVIRSEQARGDKNV